jgi:hypothetical protein
VLYRRHQLSPHGPQRAALLWLAERINALVHPVIGPTCDPQLRGDTAPPTMSQWPPNQVIVMLHAPRHQPGA